MDMNPSAEQKPKLEQVVLTQVIRMNATINGIVAGFLVGCVILIATLWLVIKGGDVVGPHLGLLDQFFPGYSVTWVGSLVGFIYGCLVGFAVGYFVSFTYNMIVDLRTFLRSRSDRQRQARQTQVDYPPSASAGTPQIPMEKIGNNGKDPVHAANETHS